MLRLSDLKGLFQLQHSYSSMILLEHISPHPTFWLPQSRILGKSLCWSAADFSLGGDSWCKHLHCQGAEVCHVRLWCQQGSFTQNWGQHCQETSPSLILVFFGNASKASCQKHGLLVGCFLFQTALRYSIRLLEGSFGFLLSVQTSDAACPLDRPAKFDIVLISR